MDYSEAMVVIESCIKRLSDLQPRGRWNEALDVAILGEQHWRAMIEECKRRKREAEAPAEHAPRRKVNCAPTIYAHLFYPDEP